MFFEQFAWEEERLGLISGISFVLIGVFGYFLYLQNPSLLSAVILVFAMFMAGATAVLFQLPRIRGTRAAISTFLGGLSIGGAIILWVIADVNTNKDLIGEAVIFLLTAAELVLVFFAIGFMFLALYPPGSEMQKKEDKKENVATSEKNNNDDDIFERL